MRWLLLLLLIGCKPSDPPVLVFAASSLTDVLLEAQPHLEAELGRSLLFNFAGSQTLRVQIEQGAPADLYLSANREHADRLVAEGQVKRPRPLAKNDLVIVVPHDNPAKITSVHDLCQARRIVLGAQAVPVGLYTERMIAAIEAEGGPALARCIQSNVVSRENNVRLVLAKVELQEADAAVVYRSDVSPARRVQLIEIPATFNQEAQYFAAIVRQGPQSDRAARLLDALSAPTSRAIFMRHGFQVR